MPPSRAHCIDPAVRPQRAHGLRSSAFAAHLVQSRPLGPDRARPRVTRPQPAQPGRIAAV